MSSIKTPPKVVYRDTFPFFFRKEDDTHTLIVRGDYSHIDQTFKLPKNKLTPPSERNGIIEAICFNEELTTRQVLNECSHLRKGPSELQHIVFLPAHYPNVLVNLLRRYGIDDEKQPLMLVCLNQIRTSVIDNPVLPTLINGGTFGKRINLVGLQDNNRTWPPNTYFLMKNM